MSMISQAKAVEAIITRPLSYFGANAENAHLPAQYLSDCRWVYVPFVGGGCELLHFAPGVQILASDLNRNAITLFQVVATEWKKDALAHALSKRLFHPDELEPAKLVLKASRIEQSKTESLFSLTEKEIDELKTPLASDIDIAEAYFIVAWMGRSGVAVARELGRYGVGCELNPEYAKLAHIRIGKADRPSTFVDPRAIDSPLFTGVEA